MTPLIYLEWLVVAVAGLTLVLVMRLFQRPSPLPVSRWWLLASIGLFLCSGLFGVLGHSNSSEGLLPQLLGPDRLLALQHLCVFLGLLALGFGLRHLLKRLRNQSKEAKTLLQFQDDLQLEVLEQLEHNRQLTDTLEDLQQKALHDPLTGLPNKLHFVGHLRGLLKRAKRRSSQVVLLRLRVEGLYPLPDGGSSQARDTIIRELASRLTLNVRESDSIGRLEEADFVVAVDDIRSTKDSHLVAANLAKALFRPLQREKQRVTINGHIGVAFYPEDAMDPDHLLNRAETALERAKTEDAGAVGYFNADWSARLSREKELLEDLKKALQQDELTLYFQPQIEIKTGRIRAVEALACWHHPTRGLMAPGEFIPLAEEAGLRAAMGDTILEQACTQLMAWNHQVSPHIQLAVNLSRQQLQQTDCVDQIKRVLAKTHFPPDRLILELPETVLVEEADNCLPTLTALRQLGVNLALDHFGGALSNLSLLHRLSFHNLKLDPALVSTLDETPQSQTLVRALLALAQNLSLGAVIDGIDNETQAKLLSQWGATTGQGIYWTRPLQPEHLLPILMEGTLTPGNRMVLQHS